MFKIIRTTGFFVTKLILFIFCLSLFSCATVIPISLDELYGKSENFHVEDQILYPDSPFNSLVKDVFSQTNTNRHYLKILEIGEDALLSRIHLIRSAKKSILIQTFIWSNDQSGRFVARELIRAAQRGVKVKIIVDQWRLKDAEKLAAYFALAHPNLEIKTYNPGANQIKKSALFFLPELAFKFKKINQRMHNKVFIVDDRIAILGGRNYENDYFDRGKTRNFKDRDVLVVGPVVRAMTDSFSKYWAFKLSIFNQDLLDVARIIEKNDLEEFNDPKYLYDQEMFFESSRLSDDYHFIKSQFVETALKVEKVKFVADIPGKNKSLGLSGGGVAATELARMLMKAKKRIVAQTPYLVLDKRALRVARTLRKNNPDLDIIISTNSLAAADHVYAYAFSYKQKKLFTKQLRFRIFEFKPVPKDISLMMPSYKPEQSLKTDKDNNYSLTPLESQNKHLCIHGKSFVIDDSIVWIGSFNVDPRSINLNTEVGLIVFDETAAGLVKDNIVRDISPDNSWTIGNIKRFAIISFFNGVLAKISATVPFVDVWPFRDTASFTLKPGKEVVPFYDKLFYQNYISVGSFPQVGLSSKEVQTRLYKIFAGVATPII
ncbi:MAG: phospholipase D family protein [Candidatus Omnitrophica bacterium]|nr:phospholipase D family protein [Candidatus Omnitrophota bacterium]